MEISNIVFMCLFVTFARVVKMELTKVAVYEHVVISPDNPTGDFTRDEAFDWMLLNLKVIREQSKLAADKVRIVNKKVVNYNVK